MNFWLLDVQSMVLVNGVCIDFNYTNTYYEEQDAIREAKLLSDDESVLQVSVQHWVLEEDGSRTLVTQEGDADIPYKFLNTSCRKLKESA